MGVAEGMWKEIHAGRAPSARSLESLVKLDAPVFGQEQRVALEARLDADVLGAGPLREALELPGVSDVLVNGTRGVWVDRGCGVERIALDLGSEEDVRRLAVRLAAAAGRRLDDASPYVDAVLPGGVRLHAVLPPLVDHGAHLSLRVPGGLRIGLGDLVARGAMDDEVAALLLALVRAKVSFVISGGTGTGKTTLLAALLRHVPHDERLLVVEDVRELAVEHPHVVRLEARSPNVEGVGEVPLAALVRQSLRMRPDRIVVGEVRGAEVRELMTALNTGHEGGCGTVHANAAADVPARFEALGALAGMSPEAVRTQLRPAISVVIHVERVDGMRRVASVGVMGGDHHGLRVEAAWQRGVRAGAWPALCDLAGVR
ncbi:TadA family conjugal transfer-associated ATPase [uncultured Dermacoccus sp.]|uniref:TadA family conjugal transfer-associated ATPase n=1 Tax=uncultured Dermacoccus sp. TaxID=339343 RepID=UPI002593D286|nr:TadA family conjugal transfer-associated ATPase [uncultured Dermacoccus sp.]